MYLRLHNIKNRNKNYTFAQQYKNVYLIMNIEKVIKVYSKLGEELISISENIDVGIYSSLIQKSIIQNPWFTKESVIMALKSIGNSLSNNKIHQWLGSYSIIDVEQPKVIGIIMAGNIPLVGFHDLLCTLISGNIVKAKLSSKDQFLYTIIKDILVKIDASFDSKIEFTDGLIKDVDAIIATGSDNSARYFEYYFNKYPNIIRKNRNSLGILTGDETVEELHSLGDDIFTYFGLGCRNVSFLLVPEGYDFPKLIESIESYGIVANHTKYFNNYEYQRAIMLMNLIPLYDNGFVLFKEGEALSSPIGVINYQYYKSEVEVENYIKTNKNKIQCIVSKTNWSFNTYDLGEAQQPELWEYADNVDTIKFLLDLNK